MEISEFALGLISGIVLLIISQIIGYYVSRKNLKAQQEHSLKTIKLQLYHEERTRALIEFDKLLKPSYKTFDDFKKVAMDFLDGELALFLPRKLRKELRGKLLELDGFMINRLAELGFYDEPPEDFVEDWEAESAAWAEAFPEEALDAEVKERLSRIKSTLRDKIKENIEE